MAAAAAVAGRRLSSSTWTGLRLPPRFTGGLRFLGKRSVFTEAERTAIARVRELTGELGKSMIDFPNAQVNESSLPIQVMKLRWEVKYYRYSSWALITFFSGMMLTVYSMPQNLLEARQEITHVNLKLIEAQKEIEELKKEKTALPPASNPTPVLPATTTQTPPAGGGKL